MSMDTWDERIKEAHSSVARKKYVVHASRLPGSSRYFVWQEDGRNDAMADDRHDVGAMQGNTDLFTDLELDPWTQGLEDSLDSFGISWEYTGCTYEANTGLWHHTWAWEVLL